MKKLSMILTIVLVVTAISATVAFASDNLSMFDSMRDWAREAKSTGEISEQEAKKWNNHFDVMEDYHEKNGFSDHCGTTDNNQGEQDMPDSEFTNMMKTF